MEPVAESDGKSQEGPVKPRSKPASQLGDDGKLLPAAPLPSMRELLESPELLDVVVANTQGVDQLHQLHELIAAVEEVSQRAKLAVAQTIRIATARLRLERRIGQHLTQSVQRGGHGSKSHNATSIRGRCFIAGLPRQDSVTLYHQFDTGDGNPCGCFG